MGELACKRLAVSLVVHHWREQDITPALDTLGRSLCQARDNGQLHTAALFVVYNGTLPENLAARRVELEAVFPFPVDILPAQVNDGYGKANNLVLERVADRGFDAVLVMNPDVTVGQPAISRLLWRLASDPACGLVVPRLLDPTDGHDVHGCKRYPSLAVLATRQFRFLQRFDSLMRLNARYEYRDWQPDWTHRGVELCSGCFMLGRLAFWQSVGGFDSRYFMYFEDFDVSLRGAAKGWVHVYEPVAEVHHAGGGAARKPLIHRWWFIRSAFRFFQAHGWRFWRVGKKP